MIFEAQRDQSRLIVPSCCLRKERREGKVKQTREEREAKKVAEREGESQKSSEWTWITEAASDEEDD